MTEADFEYLIRTLSDARSRATELTVAVRARAGADHRLADLGHSAVSNIEKLLGEIRVLALGPSERSTPAPRSDPDHWLQLFIRDLGSLPRTGDISFEAVERLLEKHKQTFLSDLETARRMYRVYPRLFGAENSRKASA